MICSQCGSEQPDGARFCSKCGALLVDATPEVVAVESQTAGTGERKRAGIGSPTSATDDSLPQGDDRSMTEPMAGSVAPDAQEPVLHPLDPVAKNGSPETTSGATKTVPSSWVGATNLGQETEEQRSKRTAADYDRAKRELKRARKAAGKSRAPMVAGVVVGVVLVAGLSAAATLTLTSGLQGGSTAELQRQVDDLSKQLDETKDELDQAQRQAQTASAATAAASTAGTAPATATVSSTSNPSGSTQRQAYVGTWSGELVETRNSSGKGGCYGAQGTPAKITIKSIADSGQVIADIGAMYHGHKSAQNQAQSLQGDEFKSVQDALATYDNAAFKFVCNFDSNDDNRLEVEVEPFRDADISHLKVTVTSYFDRKSSQVDVYELTKATE